MLSSRFRTTRVFVEPDAVQRVFVGLQLQHLMIRGDRSASSGVADRCGLPSVQSG